MKRILSLKKISRKYGKKIVFTQQDLDFYDGEIVFFVGKNGVGKTTLMEIIVGLNEADSGEIFLDNELIKIPYSAAVRRKIAYLPVDDQLIDYLTAGENLVYFAEIYKVAEYQKK